MLRFAHISMLAIRHITSCNAVRQGDTLRLAHLHMSCFSPVPAHHLVLLSMEFPINAAFHPLVSTSLNYSAYSYAFHASYLHNALLLFLSSNLFACAAVFPIFALFCQALDLPFKSYSPERSPMAQCILRLLSSRSTFSHPIPIPTLLNKSSICLPPLQTF
jgi:hypothetical protein